VSRDRGGVVGAGVSVAAAASSPGITPVDHPTGIWNMRVGDTADRERHRNGPGPLMYGPRHVMLRLFSVG
jgi:hypothetical protein